MASLPILAHNRNLSILLYLLSFSMIAVCMDSFVRLLTTEIAISLYVEHGTTANFARHYLQTIGCFLLSVIALLIFVTIMYALRYLRLPVAVALVTMLCVHGILVSRVAAAANLSAIPSRRFAITFAGTEDAE